MSRGFGETGRDGRDRMGPNPPPSRGPVWRGAVPRKAPDRLAEVMSYTELGVRDVSRAAAAPSMGGAAAPKGSVLQPARS